jgi:hypothetical protein
MLWRRWSVTVCRCGRPLGTAGDNVLLAVTDVWVGCAVETEPKARRAEAVCRAWRHSVDDEPVGMDRGDVVVAALHSELVRLEQDVGMRLAGRRLEAIGREPDQQAERDSK